MDWASCVPLVAISESARDQEKLPLHFVDVVHNGIDMSQFPPQSKKRKREDYLVWLGRFVPEKGPHLAIEAAKRAQVPLILAGTIDRYLKLRWLTFMSRSNHISIINRSNILAR